MPDSLEFLLSDEFIEFSKKIAEVHARRKAKQEEIQAIFAVAKAELGQIEAEAKGLVDEWERYKNQTPEESKK